jgi:peptidoglycan/LPS O-acetylase OafA/YrhL
VTAPTVKIVGIERLRAVAIGMVYLIHAHAYGYLKPLAQLGTWAGVDLFFVISGFVVTLSLEKLIPEREPRPVTSSVAPNEAQALRAFYVRRFFRLAPIAGCAILLHFAGACVGGLLSPASPFDTVPHWALETLSVASGLYNFIAPYVIRPPMAFFWSLSVEEQFYLLLPSLFILAPTRRSRTLAALGVLLLVAGVFRPLFSPDVFAVAHYMSQFRFDSLAAGVVLALQRHHLPSIGARVPAVIRKMAVLAGLATLVFVSKHMYIWFAIHNGLVLIWLASVCAVACAAIDSRDVLDLPVLGRVLEYVGSRSYALYVIHTAFLFMDETIVLGAGPSWHARLTSPLGETLRFATVLGIVLLVAEGAYRWIERPAIEAGKRWVARAAERRSQTPALNAT